MQKRYVFGIAIVISLLIVAGVVCVGILAGRNLTSRANRSHNASIRKAVNSICTSTDYKEACITTMSSVAHNRKASPSDVLKAAVSSVLDAVSRAGSSFVSVADDSDADKGRSDDCNELLGYAGDDLHSASIMLEESNLETLYDKEAEVINLLNAVVSYIETCKDLYSDKPELKVDMENMFVNATQLTSNALAIVADMQNVFSAFNVEITRNKNARKTRSRKNKSRRLVGSDTDNNGFPEWMSMDDRAVLASGHRGLVPNAVVAKDGSGQFSTIMQALDAYPKGRLGRYVVYVKEGIYDEYVTVTKDKVNVFMYGDGPRKTIITGSKSVDTTGLKTFKTASFSAIGNGFIAKSMGFRNTAGPKGHQAVALRSQSDRSAFYDIEADGFQDTLYTQTYRQFYSNSIISGTVDFIFGDGSVIIQNCLIVCKLPGHGQSNTVTAQGRKLPQQTTGIVIQNCHIMADRKLYPVRFQVRSYLGRPWKEYSRTVVMESLVDDFIQPDGWMPMDGNFAVDTCFYGEYANTGRGAPTGKRVSWKGFKVITDRNEAMRFTAGAFVQGNDWLKETGAPFYIGLRP